MTGVSFSVKRRYAGWRRDKWYAQSLTFRICSINYEFFQIFFLIFEIFFGSFEKTIKSYEIWICFRKKTKHYTQEVSG